MQPISADNPWIASVARGRALLPAWAVALLAIALGACAIIVGRGLGSRAASAIVAALPNAPPPWPGVLAMIAFNLIIFGPLVLIAVAACALDRRGAWLAGAKTRSRRPPAAATLGLGGFALAVGLRRPSPATSGRVRWA